jgi:hypothetical protein
VAEHGDPIGHRKGLVLVVGHEQGRRPRRGQDIGDLGAHAGSKSGIEGGEGLIEEHQARPGGEGAGQGHALLLTARELMGVAAGELAEARELHELGHPDPPAPAGEAKADVGGDGEVGKERPLLGHVPDAPALGGEMEPTVVDDAAADGDDAAIRPLETGQEAQQGRLAAPRRSQDGGQGAFGDVEIEAPQHRLGAERLVQAGDVQASGHAGGRASPRPTVGGSRSKKRARNQLGTAARAIIIKANGAAWPQARFCS